MQEHAESRDARPMAGTPLRTDPVCGTQVLPTSPHRYALNGAEIDFHSARCRDRFASDPAKYREAAHLTPEAGPTD